MRSTTAIILGCILILGIFPPGLSKAEPLVLSQTLDWRLLSPHLDYLEDPAGELTISDVISPECDSRFIPCISDVFVIGLTRSAYWVRFRLQKAPGQKTGEANEWVIDVGKTVIDKIDLYIPMKHHPVNKEDFLVKQAGVMRPPDCREVAHRNYVFRLPANFSNDAYFYMRMASSVEMHLPSFVRSRDDFERLAFWDNLAFGTLYGVMIAMAFYNLFIFFSLRDRTYFYYVLYISSILLYQTSEFGQLAVLANLRAGWQMILLWIFVGSTLFWGAVFNRSFLLTRINTPRLDKCLIVFMVIAQLVILLGLFGYHRQANMLAHTLGLLGGLLGLTTGVIVLRQGFKPARYYLLAWSVLIVGLVLWSSRGMGWLRPTFITTYTLSIGAAVESVLLSFALADRIRALRKEKDALARSRERYIHESLTDPLTGLSNARFFHKYLDKAVSQAHLENQPLSLLIFDIDDFKRFNDRYGHPNGDRVLRRFGQVVRECARESDAACRYGGEEFTLVLPGADITVATEVAERVRIRFAEHRFQPTDQELIQVTVSGGAAELQPDEDGLSLLSRSDAALYQAKAKGKNCTETII